jgi:glycerol dehydrogenase
MLLLTPYRPHAIFAVEDGPHRRVPRVLITPHRSLQGDRILAHLGRYLALLPSTRAAILISPGGPQRDGAQLVASLRQAEIDAVMVTFQGECSAEEVARVVVVPQATTPPVDGVIAVGGGKCVDAGKCVAARLAVPVVICPTVASNDAPCSAVSVMYTPAGVGAGVEFFPQSPALVVVDTRLIAEAPVRYLVAVMGDAMATWYEARTCLQNPQARPVVGARPTLAAIMRSAPTEAPPLGGLVRAGDSSQVSRLYTAGIQQIG